MIGRLRRWWRNEKRRHDREFLWAHLMKVAPNVDAARAAFRMHMEMDRDTYATMTDAEKQAFIELLEWRDDSVPEPGDLSVKRMRL